VFFLFLLGGYPTNFAMTQRDWSAWKQAPLERFFSSQVLDERIEALVI